MSYILDALKKSDQQRQRGVTPTLQTVQITAAAPRQPLFVFYVLLAAALLGVGLTIGWLRPWQPEQTPLETEIISTAPAQTSQPVAPAYLTALQETSGKTQEPLVQNSMPATHTASAPDPTKTSVAASTGIETPGAEAHIPEKPADPTDDAPEQGTMSMDELPLQIQQEIPVMAVQLHAYSNIPGERLVSVNSVRLREGGFLTPDIRLEQITPEGMIFSYKGYRFQRGIR
jgi:general secretion pathway protein B